MTGTGTATITAELNGETATVKLLVLKKITNLKMEAVSAKDQTLMDDGEIQVGGTLDLKATVMPYTSQNDAKTAKMDDYQRLDLREVRSFLLQG